MKGDYRDLDGYARGEFTDEFSHCTVPMMNRKPEEPKHEFFIVRWCKELYRQWKYWTPYNN